MHSTTGASVPAHARAMKFLRYRESWMIAAHVSFASTVALLRTPFGRPDELPLWPFWNWPLFDLFFTGDFVAISCIALHLASKDTQVSFIGSVAVGRDPTPRRNMARRRLTAPLCHTRVNIVASRQAA